MLYDTVLFANGGYDMVEKDVVYKMNVDEKKTLYKTEYGGKMYYFCCDACLKKFQKEPQKYK
ncbi:YHS domain-containing protein [Methanocella conradii]|uniref:YHS domain-containing protein n=1 Tax=Methanocella conradii TaxID=1175444 RepID=UPI0024B38347|nr:YHS domain-containing protein [Methanocella conradii]MDI6895826.1 YHS domain-containing protein [Methanocella conradii]